MSIEETTRTLAAYNAQRLLPGYCGPDCPTEIAYIEQIRQEVAYLLPCNVSYDWYERLLTDGPGQGDSLFPWLAEQATREQMVWFLSQEAAGEAGFGDLVAMTSVKMPHPVKLEMARNYWDEMGQGKLEGLHDRLLDGVNTFFGIVPDRTATVWEALRLGNLMVGLASHRCYAYQAVGALGAIEMTAPGRVALVDQGLARLGVPRDARRYFSLHATLDLKHSRDWNEEVIKPLAPVAMRAMAEGALMRLWVGSRCFQRYRLEFGLE